ncbi:hypothetical protein HFP89_14775 [Wenzhouxiangella sp. XN79A]|uniref:glycosyltransferase family 10 domain-containing protein n=1 Tax=Wenzhouxiangella sp. XN79A TaxID=2724193 RepID=UPI00144AE30C|nr:glycosyltransferase family 10 [Wenzhouxiangella sp. XN79A]NKI36432.1 hypothetical protein [Wenzhouxiangella sp. XN79A]
MVYKVKFSIFPDWPIERQLPLRGPRWGEFEFHVNAPVERADFWVVSAGMFDAERCICPPNRTLFVTYEPSSVHEYDPLFLGQFAAILTCQRNIQHPGVTYGPQGQQWFAGLSWPDLGVTEDYDSLAGMSAPKKTKLISLVSSRKVMTREHERRLKTVERLKETFAGVLDVYGNGFKAVPDKLDAILPYKYHLVLENCREKDYWSEKLADAYLGWAYPLYWGCPNLSDYLPGDAFEALPVDGYDEMAGAIEDVLEADAYEQKRAAIGSARDLVLNEQNVFGRVTSILREMTGQTPADARPLLIRDERHFIARGPLAQSARNGRSFIRRLFGLNIPNRKSLD